MHQNELNERRRTAERITLLGSLLDTVLGIVKIIIGITANSAALVADGIHSLSDLVTDVMVVAVLRLSHQEPDKEHPWGHARFETVGTVALGILLIAVAAAMAYESLAQLFDGSEKITPAWPALVAAFVSIVAKEWIFRYTLKVGQRLKSDLIIANAWHSRTDAFSSIIVFIAVIGAMLGALWLDAVASVIVAVMVGKVGWDLMTRSITELVDTALPEEQINALRKTVKSVEGVINVHSFKTRQMGSNTLLEMHLQVAPDLSAAEGHYIGDHAVTKLKQQFDDITYIIFHIDTYDDQSFPEDALMGLPPRDTIKQHLDAILSRITGAELDYRLTLLYQPNRVNIELQFDDSLTETCEQVAICPSELKQEATAELSAYDWFGHLTINIKVA